VVRAGAVIHCGVDRLRALVTSASLTAPKPNNMPQGCPARFCLPRFGRRERSRTIITRLAKASDAVATSALTATVSPVRGLGGAAMALVNAPVANTATKTRIQNERRGERLGCRLVDGLATTVFIGAAGLV
jgi:hypothetical protein